MAMDQEVAEIVSGVAAESQDRLDVRLLRQQDARSGLDGVMKMEGRATVRIESQERRRLRPVRVENRKNVGHAASAVAVEFIEAANGQGGESEGLHIGSRNTKANRRRPASTAPILVEISFTCEANAEAPCGSDALVIAPGSVRKQHRRRHVREDVARAGAVAEQNVGARFEGADCQEVGGMVRD